MNRILVFLFLVLSSLSVSAQLSGDGYYRVQNQYTSRYVVVLSNKGDINYASNEVDLGSIETLKNFDKVVSNPASIIYIESHGSDGYILKAQGTDTYSMIGYYLKIRDNKNGTYRAYATAAGITKYLTDEATTASEGVLLTNGSKTRDWYIKPVNLDDEQYFGITPEYTDETGGYATIYASFPFSFASEGMKAYYVYKIDVNRNVAVCKEINGTVPAATPVIIKCSSATASGNKLNLLKNNVTGLSGNLLDGVYFKNSNKKLYNQKEYNPATMRVLGKMDNGEIGFVTANYDYLPANKAYLNVPAGLPSEISMIDYEDYVTGVEDITAKIDDDKAIYTLTGVKINSDVDHLPSGIYVIKGKKVVVR